MPHVIQDLRNLVRHIVVEQELHSSASFNVLGAVIWVTSLVYGGYLFGNLPIIRDNLGLVLFVGLAAAAGPVLLAGAVRFLRMRRAPRAG